MTYLDYIFILNILLSYIIDNCNDLHTLINYF